MADPNDVAKRAPGVTLGPPAIIFILGACAIGLCYVGVAVFSSSYNDKVPVTVQAIAQATEATRRSSTPAPAAAIPLTVAPTATTPPTVALTATIPPTVAPTAETSRCITIPAPLLEGIAEGLTKVEGGGSLRFGMAVKSNDFNKAYFIAADIEGPGMDGEEVGLWVSNTVEWTGAALMYSVNSFAKTFSDWADGTKTDAGFSMFNDGAQEAVDCVLEILRQ